MPFIPGFTDKFKQIGNKNIKAFFQLVLTSILNKYIKVQKDHRIQSTKCNVIYKIGCKECVFLMLGKRVKN